MEVHANLLFRFSGNYKMEVVMRKDAMSPISYGRVAIRLVVLPRMVRVRMNEAHGNAYEDHFKQRFKAVVNLLVL